MLIALLLGCVLAGVYAAPLASDGVKRQQLSLYGDPLTHDQIIQLIKDHMNSKRQPLSLYGDPLTHDQIMQLIKDHMNSKRQQLPVSLYGEPLTHDQIIQLIKDHMTTKREGHSSALHNLLHTLLHAPQDFQFNSHISPFLSIATIDQPTWTTLVSDLSFTDILNIIGDLWKGH